MANRDNRMGFMTLVDSSAFGRATPVRQAPSIGPNEADDKVFATMHRNKANFSIEKVGAVFANLPRRKIG